MVRIVVADDDPHSAEALASVCRELADHVAVAHDGEQALTAIRAEPTEVVLLDLNMPKVDGFGVLQDLRTSPVERPPAVIIVTAQTDVAGKVRGTDLGAVDFLEKPFRLDDLRRRVERALGMIELERRLKDAERTLDVIKGTDSVTGAGSFGQLYMVLEAEFHCAKIGRRPLSCVVVSDESYASMLTTRGRSAGDERLQRLHDLIKRRLRAADYIFRVDAAEFVLLLPATEGPGAHLVVRKIADTIESLDDLMLSEFAIAVATYPHGQIEHAAALFRAVNVALAQARSRPDERVAYFEHF